MEPVAENECESEYDVCALCERRLDDDVGEAWLSLEVYRAEDDYFNVSFCRQEHAAEWLTKPLPPVEPATQDPDSPWAPWWERLGCALALLLAASAAGLAVLGAYTLVRMLGGWD
jgi:hypothetical protein